MRFDIDLNKKKMSLQNPTSKDEFTTKVHEIKVEKNYWNRILKLQTGRGPLLTFAIFPRTRNQGYITFKNGSEEEFLEARNSDTRSQTTCVR